MNHPAADFGNRLRRLRRVRGYSQSELGRCIQRDQRRIAEWENDHAKPQFDALIRLAEVLDVSLDELMRGPL